MDVGGTERLALKYSRRMNLLGTAAVGKIFGEAADELLVLYRKRVQSFRPGDVPDLTPGYKKQKRAAVGTVYPILWRTGYLISHLARRVYARPWRIRLLFGGGQHPEAGIPTKRLAEIHIKGEGRVPPRDFTQLPEEWVKRWKDRLRRRLRRAVNRKR